MQKSYIAVGLMSGSSLDGVDLVLAKFELNDCKWQFEILAAECVAYPAFWENKLKNIRTLDGVSLWQTHVDLGRFYGEIINDFLTKNKTETVDVIGSHGHTVFHFPDKKMTCQIGDGAAIAATTQAKVVCDLRAVDVANGGQGAPIVPIGDSLLFAEFSLLLNIGGIANISAKINDKIIAFDCCTANQLLNFYANQLGEKFDANGEIARSGKLNNELLADLNSLDFFAIAYPKSLDNGFKEKYLAIAENYAIPIADKLHTIVEHIAFQIQQQIFSIEKKEQISFSKNEKLLVTGGGALSGFLIEKIKEKIAPTVVVPTVEIINYKEALIMAFIAILRIREENNVLQKVTGASKDSIGGAIYNGK